MYRGDVDCAGAIPPLLAELARAGRLSWARACELAGNARTLDAALEEWHALGLPVERQGDALVWSPVTTPLAAAAIGEGLAALGEPCPVRVELLVDSTNARLLEASAAGVPPPLALLAECQTQGRGRRQRRWLAGHGGALLMSVLLSCPRPPAELPGIAIVSGLAVVKALRALGVAGLGLKWPNDVLLDGAKLAGILVESGGRHGQVVVGVGLNWLGAGPLAAALGRPVAALQPRLPDGDRNRVAAAVLAAVLGHSRRFAAHGLRASIDEFARFDVLAGRPVSVATADARTRYGIAMGLAPDGGLKVDHGGTIAVYHSADVSVVPA